MTTWQDEAFVNRLARLDAGHAHRRKHHKFLVDGSGRASGSSLGRALSMTSAVIIGCLAVLISRYAMFQTQGMPNGPADPGLAMIIDALFAFCIAFVIRMALDMTSRMHFSASIIGVFIALTTVHNLVHAYPDAWARAFSSEWVAHTTENTAPKSLYIRGRSFHLTEIMGVATPEAG
ncbi:MAG: hypothetical protein AAGL96_11965 [Pseudomonadota bacterium]